MDVAFLLISGLLALAVAIAAGYWAQRGAGSDDARRPPAMRSPMTVQSVVFGVLIIVIGLIYGISRWP